MNESTGKNAIGLPASPAFLENISDAVIIVDEQWRLLYINQSAETIIRFKRDTVAGRVFFDVFPDTKDTIFELTYRRVMESKQAETFEAPFGEHHTWFWVSAFPGENGTLCIAFHENSLKRRLEIVATVQREALSAALSGVHQTKVLNILAHAVQHQAGHKTVAAISLIHEGENRLKVGAAPNLPDDLIKTIHHKSLSDNYSLLARCYNQRDMAVARDLTQYEQTSKLAREALRKGFKSLWSTPIFSARNTSVLGIFTLFYSESRSPVESDVQVVDALSRTAAIIIERNRENQARRKAEQALSENTETLNKQRRLYETALSNTPDLLYIFNLEGQFTYANDALLEMWGLSWDEAIGKTCLELGYEPWHADMHMREIEQVIRTRQPIRGDVPFTGTHGRRIYDYIFMPVIGDDGKVEAIAGSTRDVTERHKAEEMAKKAESRRRLALEASHSFGIWDWDITENVFTADERLGELFNLTHEEAEGGVPIELPMQYIHKDDIENNQRAIEKSIANGTPYNEEYRILQKDGSIRWGSFRGRVMYNKDGEPVRFPGVGVDITREREAINALQEADQRKDEFLATLAHELRNPLAPIRNAMQILHSDVFSEQKKREAFSLVDRQVTQMVRLVDDLMDVSRITRGKIRLNRTPVDIGKVLEAAIETVQPLIDESKHSLNVSYPSESVWVDGDLIRLSQIFSNIINNAAKYTSAQGHINVNVQASGDEITVVIADNGAGIPPEKLHDIFDMFSQVDGVLERAQGGLGIGLTLVKKLTELHDGHVDVHSEGLGHGTTFTVTLPRIAAPEQSSRSPAIKELADANKEIRVLIADDNQDAAITMGWILEAKGCCVVVVENGFDALDAVNNFTPDLVLLDIGMPGMNGYDLCVALQKIPSLASATFVAQTGWGQPSHIQRSKESGFHHHLVKPLDMNDLLPVIDEVRVKKSQ